MGLSMVYGEDPLDSFVSLLSLIFLDPKILQSISIVRTPTGWGLLRQKSSLKKKEHKTFLGFFVFLTEAVYKK